jgi:Frag1/DRAM/Sfk1 family
MPTRIQWIFMSETLIHDRLIPDMRKRESVFGALAAFGSFVGGCGLILLSIFDTRRHHSLHRAFLLVFMLGVAASAIFTVVEVHFISSV